MRRYLGSLTLAGGLLWAQMFPTLDNRVAEIRVTELSQSGDRLKVTVQNRSARTIRAMTVTLGRHKVEQDWNSRAGGGLGPNEVATVVISTTGIRAGGTRHHPEPPGPLVVFGAVFADALGGKSVVAEAKSGGGIPAQVMVGAVGKSEPAVAISAPTTRTPAPPAAAPPVPAVDQLPKPAPAPPAQVTVGAVGKSEPAVAISAPTTRTPAPPAAAPPVPAVDELPKPAPAPPARVTVGAVGKSEPAVAISAPTTRTPAPPAPAVAPVPRTEVAVDRPKQQPLQIADPSPETAPQQLQLKVRPPLPSPPPVKAAEVERAVEAPKQEAPKPPRPSGQPGTREQGRKDELARLIKLLEVYEPDMAGFPRPTLRLMAAAVANEQNELGTAPALAPFDEGQRNALQTFAYSLQLIKDRRDLDDDALKEQVARFMKNQRQALLRP